MTQLFIITGRSGAGKSLAADALEDMGFFCTDNLPAKGLAEIAPALLRSCPQARKCAIVLDSRGVSSIDEGYAVLDALKQAGVNYRILFLDADDAALMKRHRAARRCHPMQTGDRDLAQAYAAESCLLVPLQQAADYRIDTTQLSPSLLKSRMIQLLEQPNEVSEVTLMSFGFRYGQPLDADILLDVRCLPNPFYVPSLKQKTGLEDEVAQYIMSFPQSQQLYERLYELVRCTLLLYSQEGRRHTTVAIGCTGGRHRSVAFVNQLARDLQAQGRACVVLYRDMHGNL